MAGNVLFEISRVGLVIAMSINTLFSGGLRPMKRTLIVEYDDELIDPLIAFETLKMFLTTDDQENPWTGLMAGENGRRTRP